MLSDAVSEENMYEIFGATLTAFLSSFTFTLFMALMVADQVRRWQVNELAKVPDAVAQFPGRFLFDLALLAIWTYGLGRFCRFAGWPKWLALPYVVFILSPCAWLLSCRIEEGGDFIGLFLLQLPVLFGYVRCIRNAAKYEHRSADGAGLNN